jgi:ER membrane protein complex subunit 1
MMFVFWLLLGLLPFTFALHASEAGVVDWHKPLMGLPITHSDSSEPSFHRFKSKNGTNKITKSVVLSATNANVLAALDAANGDICGLMNNVECSLELTLKNSAWRFAFDAEDPLISYRASGNGAFHHCPSGSLIDMTCSHRDLVGSWRLNLPFIRCSQWWSHFGKAPPQA